MQHIINNFLQKESQIKPKYFTEFTTKHHKNCLHLSSLSPYPASQLDVFGHDGDSLSVDAHGWVSSNKPTRHASLASWSAPVAALWTLRSVSKSWAMSLTNLWKGASGSEARRTSGHGGSPEGLRSQACSDEVSSPAGGRGASPGGLSGQLCAGRFPTRGLTDSLLGSGHFLLPNAEALEAPPTAAPPPLPNGEPQAPSKEKTRQGTTKPLYPLLWYWGTFPPSLHCREISSRKDVVFYHMHFSSSIERIVWVLSFLLIMWCITFFFANVEPPLQPRNISHLVMVNNLFNVLWVLLASILVGIFASMFISDIDL